MGSHIERKICRLCLQRCDQCEIIEGVTRQILNSLLLKLNLDVSDGPVMCDNCAFNLKQSFCFKSMVGVFTPIIKLEDDAALDLREPFLNGEDNQNTQESRTVCGICMNSVKTGFFIPLDNLDEEGIFQRIMLEECLPDLNLNTTKNPVICTTCNKSLKNHYNFVTECANIEQNIKLYCETNGINDGKISLHNVRKFKYKGMFCAEDNYLVEEEHCNDQEHQNEENEMENKSTIEVIEHEVVSDTGEKFELDMDQQDSSEIKVEFPQLEVGVILSTSGTISVLQSQEPHFERPKRTKHSQESPSGITNHNSEKCSDKIKDKTNARKRKIANEDIIETVSYRCQSCTFTTEHEDSLTQHMLTHTKKVVMYRCESCPFETKYVDSLKRHTLIHGDPSEVTMYPCKHCSYRSRYEANSKTHMKKCKTRKKSNKVIKKHPVKEIKYTGQSHLSETKSRRGRKRRAVSKDMPNQIESKKRQINPAGIKLFKCNFCSYQSRYKANLQKHELLHYTSEDAKSQDADPLGFKMYKCYLCSFQSRYKASLQRHTLFHRTLKDIKQDSLKTKMFCCDSCLFQTKYKHSLLVHALLHNYSSQDVHQCEYCKFTTIYKGNLQSHVKRRHKEHLKSMTFQCKLCSYETEYRGSLRRHNTIRHSSRSEVKIHKCKSCKYQTKVKGKLAEHMQKHYKCLEKNVYQCCFCLFKTQHKNLIERHGLIHNVQSNI